MANRRSFERANSRGETRRLVEFRATGCPPAGIQTLVDFIAQQLSPVESLPPLGAHYFRDEEAPRWEVTLFPAATEQVGGKHDGLIVPARFVGRFHGLFRLFGSTAWLYWQPTSLGPDDPLGAHIAVEGSWCGEPILLRILAQAPAGFPVGRRLNGLTGEIEELW